MNKKMLMKHCIDIARNGIGNVSPNPMVGCVIVKNGRIVGTGFHERYGGPHAEAEALKSAGKNAKGATLIVNLEPCSHFGKTPPCADAIVSAGVSNVIIAMKDPNPLVRGKGIEILRKAGVRVEVGLMKKEAESLNEKFVKFMKTGLPYVSIKMAQTIDGRAADAWGTSKWITSERSRKIVHFLRREHDAVVVGANTVRKDDPELTVRYVRGRNPLRILLDGRLSVPLERKIFRTDKAPTWIVTSAAAVRNSAAKMKKLTARGVRIIQIKSNADELEPVKILKQIAAEGVTSVFIEGGSGTAGAFLGGGFADKLYLFTALKILGSGQGTFDFKIPKKLGASLVLKNVNVRILGSDLLIESYL